MYVMKPNLPVSPSPQPSLRKRGGGGTRGAGGGEGQGVVAYSAAARIGSAWSSASSTRGGDIGRSRKRTPIASAIALATAAIGGTIGTSPTPRAPNGWRGLGTSTITVSIIGISEATGQR